jgi:hypothetical protein
MKLKVQSNADSGSIYVAAIDDETGEHRATATLNQGEEVTIDLPGFDVGAAQIGEVTGGNTVTTDAPEGGAEESAETEAPVDPASPGADEPTPPAAEEPTPPAPDTPTAPTA